MASDYRPFCAFELGTFVNESGSNGIGLGISLAHIEAVDMARDQHD